MLYNVYYTHKFISTCYSLLLLYFYFIAVAHECSNNRITTSPVQLNYYDYTREEINNVNIVITPLLFKII